MQQPPLPFGRYQLLERLAVGGMAELYRARSLPAAGVSKTVVVKKILPAFAGQRDFEEMFVNEARIAVSLSHGNIAQVFDFGEVDGDYYLAMEYVRGQPLSRVIRRAHALGLPSIPEEFAVFIALEMTRGLHYAHTRTDEAHRPLHIIHRDVSPQNVIVGYEGEVKIVDFGIARARGASDSDLREGAVKGKYPYFSPELVRGDEVDLRADVYATGVVLYQMSCGRLPHEGRMVPAMQSILRGDFPAPRTLHPGLAPELEQVILTAMAYAPEARYPSADAFGHALSDHLHRIGVRIGSRGLGELMAFLFEPELLAEGVDVKPARSVIERVPAWRRSGRAPSPQPAEPGHTLSGPTAPGGTATATGARRRRGQAMAALLPLAAVGVGGSAAVIATRPATFSLSVASIPEGATVEVDGQPVHGATPLTVTDLSSASPHRLTVHRPGHPDWSTTVSGEAGTVRAVTANLAPEGVPGASPGAR
jgi:eukaryotic-like serine/threonine-protein kinase